MLPDHGSPLTTRPHTPEPVPYMLVYSRTDGPGGVFTEVGVAGESPVTGHELLPTLLAG
jgi:2,3-bisphosphoglycerate-independent phosphoglycerate mutase